MSSSKKVAVATKTAKPAVVATKEKEQKPAIIGAAAGAAVPISPSSPIAPAPVTAIVITGAAAGAAIPTSPSAQVVPVAPAPKGSIDSALQGMKVYITSLLKFVASDIGIPEEKMLSSANKYDYTVVVNVASQSGKRTRSLPSEKKPKAPTKIAGKICEFFPSGGRGSKCKEEVSVRSKTGKYCSRHMRKERCQGKNKQGETCGSLVVEGGIYCSECLGNKGEKKEKDEKEKKPKIPKKEEEDDVEEETSNDEEVELAPDDE
jgi:hypothetical protein